jgi:hypothetical protein
VWNTHPAVVDRWPLAVRLRVFGHGRLGCDPAGCAFDYPRRINRDTDMRKPKPQGRGIVKALGQEGTTGNFARIEAKKGTGAAIGALQNKLAKHRGKPAPYGGGRTKPQARGR